MSTVIFGTCSFEALWLHPRVPQVEGETYQLKPMNCPFHVEIYKNSYYSYRDLPLRWAELGTVYRYERSGAMQGLFRVRGFTQVSLGSSLQTASPSHCSDACGGGTFCAHINTRSRSMCPAWKEHDLVPIVKTAGQVKGRG